MSAADPRPPANATLQSDGNVFRQPIYTTHNGMSNTLEMVQPTYGGASYQADQVTIPPFRADLHRKHPCALPNEALARCSARQPAEMLLAARSALCNDERQALLKCFVKSKGWQAPPQTDAWWKFWDRSSS